MRRVFKNGTAVIGTELCRVDIVTESGRIAAIGDFSHDPGDAVDCTGLILMPGVIDAHCHIQLDTGIFQTPDDWRQGSREAAHGGITSVIDFVGPFPGETLRHALDHRLEEASPAAIDYTFHMTALDANPRTLAEIAECPKWGITSLKLYTTYRPNYYLDDESLLAILRAAAAADLVVLVHCENDAIVSDEGKRHEGENLWRSYPERRPAIAEEEAAARVIALAKYAGAAVTIAHNSSERTAAIAAMARREGARVFNETAPQYLFLSDRDNHNDAEPWRFILQPPLRPAKHNAGLQDAVLRGDVSFIITDHCAYTRDQKIHGMTGGCPGGLPGLETLLPLTMAIPGMTWQAAAKLLSENPAKTYGLWGKKGALLPGFDADITAVCDECFIIDEKRLHGGAGYSPFNGHAARGIVTHTIRRGTPLLIDGRFDETTCGTGEFILPPK